MQLNIKKTFSILLSLLIFLIINLINTYALFVGFHSSINIILRTIFYFITIFVLVGYMIEVTHSFISSNCQEIKLSTLNLDILKYLKHTTYLMFVLTIFNLILAVVSVFPIKFLSDILQLLIVFIISFIIPCGVIIYAKNLKIKDTLNYKIYYQLIKNNFKKFLVTYLSTTIFFIVFLFIAGVVNTLFGGPAGGNFIDYEIYLFNYIGFFIYFLIILIYSQLFRENKT